ncbi:hypothetical protein [Bradyrhizobium sp. RDM4]
MSEREQRKKVVMPGLDPGIHDSPWALLRVDGRDKPGHDERG